MEAINPSQLMSVEKGDRAMRNIFLAASISMLMSSTVVAQDQGFSASFELVNGLMECSAKLDAASETGHAVEGLSTARISSKGALEFVLGKTGMNAERRKMLSQLRAEALDEFRLNPMNARENVRALAQTCMEHVYEAEDVRIQHVEAQRADTARREAAEAELKLKQVEAARAVAMEAERQHAVEMAKINAETERLKINKVSDLESERMKVNLETRKIDAVTVVDLSKIEAETDRLSIQKRAEVETERTKASVETARVGASAYVDATRINADANVSVAGKLVDIATTQETGKVERAKINAAANTEIAKSGSQALTNIAVSAARSEALKADASIEVARAESAAGLEAAISGAGGAMRSKENTAVMNGALECGGFYHVMLNNAPKDQRAGISTLASDMFVVARQSGATDEMISDAPQVMLTRIKASATKSKQLLQKELSSLKERCSTLGDVAKL